MPCTLCNHERLNIQPPFHSHVDRLEFPVHTINIYLNVRLKTSSYNKNRECILKVDILELLISGLNT